MNYVADTTFGLCSEDEVIPFVGCMYWSGGREEETGDTDFKMPSASTELQQDQIPHQPEFPDASTGLKPRLLLSVTKKGGCDDVND